LVSSRKRKKGGLKKGLANRANLKCLRGRKRQSAGSTPKKKLRGGECIGPGPNASRGSLQDGRKSRQKGIKRVDGKGRQGLYGDILDFATPMRKVGKNWESQLQLAARL